MFEPDVFIPLPRHHWFRLTLTTGIEPGHGWVYEGMVRRDTLSVRGVGLVVMRMPKKQRNMSKRREVIEE